MSDTTDAARSTASAEPPPTQEAIAWETGAMASGELSGERRARPARVSLSDSVYDILLAELIDGTIPAGSPLNIDALARHLSVSQTPIREALARLESTGMVRRTALKGYTAAALFTEKELSDLMDARALIEPANAYLACEQVTPTLLADLQKANDELRQFSTQDSSKEFHRYWEADEKFHQLIAASSDNRFLRSAYDALGGHAQRFRLFAVLGVTDADFAAAEHTAILQAFEAGLPAEAQRAMSLHIANVKTRAREDSEALA
jgi:DNA-binding GntR family transcriptional regulator